MQSRAGAGWSNFARRRIIPAGCRHLYAQLAPDVRHISYPVQLRSFEQRANASKSHTRRVFELEGSGGHKVLVNRGWISAPRGQERSTTVNNESPSLNPNPAQTSTHHLVSPHRPRYAAHNELRPIGPSTCFTTWMSCAPRSHTLARPAPIPSSRMVLDECSRTVGHLDWASGTFLRLRGSGMTK